MEAIKVMRLSTRGRYGVRAMLDLAINSGKSPASLRDIALRQEVSADYLEQLMRRLRTAGLAVSVRGPHGGFRLTRLAEKITLWEIVSALEDEIAAVHCVDDAVGVEPRRKPCDRKSTCAAHLLWKGLSLHIRGYLEKRTLADLRREALKISNQSVRKQPLPSSD